MLPEDEKTITIARRTKKNLEYIYQSKADEADVEEFTQLVNSMLSMVISLREDFFKGGDYSWEEVEILLLPSWNPELRDITGKDPSSDKPNLKKAKSFSQLMANIRHAFAHNCYDFFSKDTNGEIHGVTVWNLPLRTENLPINRTWEADIEEAQLRSFAYLVIDFLEHTIGRHFSDK
jgi:hypothetical protein